MWEWQGNRRVMALLSGLEQRLSRGTWLTGRRPMRRACGLAMPGLARCHICAAFRPVWHPTLV